MSLAFIEDGHGVRLKKKGVYYFCHLERLAIHGGGTTVDAALSDLDRRYIELRDFSAKADVPIESLVSANPERGRTWRRRIGAAVLVVIVFGALMVPFSYALSGAIERAVVNLDLSGGRNFWRNLETSLQRAADPASAPSPDEQARNVAAIRALAARMRPYVDALKPAFSDTPGPEKPQQ
jgi:hypothetical protein